MNYFQPHTWNAECARCGFEFKAANLKKEWEGFHVCEKCYERRHPGELFRYRPKEHKVPWTQPPSDMFVEPFSVKKEDL